MKGILKNSFEPRDRFFAYLEESNLNITLLQEIHNVTNMLKYMTRNRRTKQSMF